MWKQLTLCCSFPTSLLLFQKMIFDLWSNKFKSVWKIYEMIVWWQRLNYKVGGSAWVGCFYFMTGIVTHSSHTHHSQPPKMYRFLSRVTDILQFNPCCVRSLTNVLFRSGLYILECDRWMLKCFVHSACLDLGRCRKHWNVFVQDGSRNGGLCLRGVSGWCLTILFVWIDWNSIPIPCDILKVKFSRWELQHDVKIALFKLYERGWDTFSWAILPGDPTMCGTLKARKKNHNLDVKI